MKTRLAILLATVSVVLSVFAAHASPAKAMLCGAGCGVSGAPAVYYGCLNAICCNPNYVYYIQVIQIPSEHIEVTYQCDRYVSNWAWVRLSERNI